MKFRERLRLGQVAIVLILSGLIEALSIGFVYPFVVLLAENGEVSTKTNPLLSILDNIYLSQLNQPQLLIVTILFALLIGTITRLFCFWISSRTGAQIAANRSALLFSDFLKCEIDSEVHQNANLILTAVTEHTRLISVSIIQFLQLLSSFVLVLTLSILLLFYETELGIFIILTLFCIYSALTFTSRKRIGKNSTIVREAGQQNVDCVISGINLFRDIKLNSLERPWSLRQSKFVLKERFLDAQNQFLGQYPRPLIESIFFFLAILATFLSTFTKLNKSNLDILFGVFIVFVLIQKVLPVMQNIYFSLSCIKSSSSATKKFLSLEEDVKDSLLISRNNSSLRSQIGECDIQNIRFLEVNYTYPYKTQPVFETSLSFEISRGEFIAISGASGSGKSTLMDLLSGLINPSIGKILINNKSLNLNQDTNDFRNLLRQGIGYVSQSPQIFDASILTNIGLSDYGEIISREKVIYASKISQLHEFIMSLPQGYETIIGQHGIDLSGGQIQRLAIGRSIYRSPQVLILDESTSGLDLSTQTNLIESIRSAMPNTTLIICSHDPTLISLADRVFKISAKCKIQEEF